jgi:isoleucyl-tRNA synthetase
LVTSETAAALEPFAAELADLCGVSRFGLASGDEPGVSVVDLREEPRCERSWKRDGTVRERSDGGMLSDRDAAAVGVS